MEKYDGMGAVKYIMHLIAILNISLRVINNAQVLAEKSLLRSCKVTQITTIREMFGDTYKDCLDECRRRQTCTAVRYHKQTKYCSLLDGLTDVQSLDTAGPLCVYSTVGIDDRYQSGSCELNKCEKHETCVNPKYQKSDKPCIITECPEPPAIENALLLSNARLVGNRNRYKCMSGFMGNGSPAINCLTNGSWSFTDFQCQKMCQPPKASYRTADLAKDWSQNDRMAYFRCKPDYRSNTITFQLTCNSSGSWVHLPFGHLPCYGEGQEYFEQNTTKVLYRPFATRNMTSATEANATCQQQSGSLHTVWIDVAKEAEKKFSFDAILTGLTKTGMKNYDLLKNCFEIIHGNGSEIDRFKSMSYDEQVHEIQQNKTTYDTDGCKTARFWKSGEPNGGDAENCILRMKNVGYQMYDVPCNRLWLNITICFVCRFNLEYVKNV
ncbi:uncharacterized protein LOC127882466 [Dreissena polymorpha]|uniref:Sushi domain-containing protein n=1 Tax=Dreissena polymorpha TaxID=45954 RepID=A0A9D4GJP6_DREPO|nr:uncharacterized protein LOC127882466 [Dreissena polymorpha]KAH3816659.1 hypothetical protein DPMN_118179 [Dreissena polymorpha]